ncbi:GntR family transcriptional regulator, frlABCD operon transcriptional regulator [Halobacillus dabanensis]|uniref:GntR family transcriptional regulator, frlABCD operon transcriptional regulator n=1 Tax=Halobacillus dabanensis TaxID=240302 RepID=A0A1I3S6F9_HALDA|nr:UTRA domain-containing protein [Halobacillus dabanensis]SFJ53111.1 GntR family transcriptional regulator, frlABCD operon transcriptional regulator [Halobacillus dabanensis]
MKLNNASSKPLYMQVKELITADIENGIYKPGEQLSSESELCRVYDTSRITIRRAILDLVDEGVLTRQQGKGTFVNEGKIQRELIAMSGFSQFVEEMGEVPKTSILSIEKVVASEFKPKLAEVLKENQHTPLLELRRLHFLGDTPMIYEASYYSLSRFPNLENLIKENPSTYQTLKKHYDVQPMFNEKKLNGKTATTDVADYLNISKGSPLFEMEELVSCDYNIPIHFSTSLLPANKVTFTLNSSFKR